MWIRQQIITAKALFRVQVVLIEEVVILDSYSLLQESLPVRHPAAPPACSRSAAEFPRPLIRSIERHSTLG